MAQNFFFIFFFIVGFLGNLLASEGVRYRVLETHFDEMISQHRYDKAIKFYEEEIAKENPAAMYKMAELCLDHRHFMLDIEKGVELLKEAALKGSSEALFQLGQRCYWNQETDKKPEKALEFYIKASEMGHSEALYHLGLGYSRGLIIEKDLQKAVWYFKKSAAVGNIQAMLELGIIYISEKKFINYSKAFELFMKIYEKGNLNILLYISKLYEWGFGFGKNREQAAKFYELYVLEKKYAELIEYYDHKRIAYSKETLQPLSSQLNTQKNNNSILKNGHLSPLCIHNKGNEEFKGLSNKIHKMEALFRLMKSEDIQKDPQSDFIKMLCKLFKFTEKKRSKIVDLMLETEESDICKILNSPLCFVPVSLQTYQRFPCAQWERYGENCLKFPLASYDIGMCLYFIDGQSFASFTNKAVALCNNFLTSLYQKVIFDPEELELRYLQRDHFEQSLKTFSHSKKKQFLSNAEFGDIRDDLVYYPFLFRDKEKWTFTPTSNLNLGNK